MPHTGEPGFRVGSKVTDDTLDTRDPPTIPPSWGNPRQPPPAGMGGGRMRSTAPSDDELVAREFRA